MNLKIKVSKTVSPTSLMLFLFACFFVLKMNRSFSQSSVQGGIWNYIQVFTVFMGGLLFILRARYFWENNAIRAMLLFSVVACLNSLLFLSFNRSDLFSFLTLPYAFCVLVIIYQDGVKRQIDKNPYIVVAYYIISAMFFYFMVAAGKYSTRTGAVADAYYVLGLLPMMLICTKRYKLLPVLLCGAVIVVSGKRAGFLALALMMIAYFLVEAARTKSVRGKFRVLLYVVSSAAAIAVFFFLANKNFNSRLLLRLLRIREDGGSGRQIIWEHVVWLLKRSRFIQLFSGHGDGALSKTFGHAHNDFLEVTYNHGLLCCGLYILFYVRLVKAFVHMFRAKYEYSAQFLMAIICSLVLSMFSFYVIDATYITSGMICVGYMLADFNKKYGTALNKERAKDENPNHTGKMLRVHGVQGRLSYPRY